MTAADAPSLKVGAPLARTLPAFEHSACVAAGLGTMSNAAADVDKLHKENMICDYIVASQTSALSYESVCIDCRFEATVPSLWSGFLPGVVVCEVFCQIHSELLRLDSRILHGSSPGYMHVLNPRQ